MIPEINKIYEIAYKDPNYPCGCPCHTPGLAVLHFVACCYDNSYYGPAKCMRTYKSHPDYFEFVKVGKQHQIIGSSHQHIYAFHISHIVKELPNVSEG